MSVTFFKAKKIIVIQVGTKRKVFYGPLIFSILLFYYKWLW